MSTPTYTRELDANRTEAYLLKMRPDIKEFVRVTARARRMSMAAYLEQLVEQDRAQSITPTAFSDPADYLDALPHG